MVESFHIDRKDWEFVWVFPQISHGNGILRGSAEFSLVILLGFSMVSSLGCVMGTLYHAFHTSRFYVKKLRICCCFFWDRILRTNWCEDCGCLLFLFLPPCWVIASLRILTQISLTEDLSLFCPSSFHQISSWTLW